MQVHSEKGVGRSLTLTFPDEEINKGGKQSRGEKKASLKYPDLGDNTWYSTDKDRIHDILLIRLQYGNIL